MPNRKAKDRKQKRKKQNTWLLINGRTAKQYKKKKLKNEGQKRGNIYGI